MLKLRSFLRHEDGLSDVALLSLVSERAPVEFFELMSSSLTMFTFFELYLALLAVLGALPLVGVESLLLAIELLRLRVFSSVGSLGASGSLGESGCVF